MKILPKHCIYGSEHVAKVDDKIGVCNAGDDIAHPHNIILADEHLAPSSHLGLVCQNISFVFISSLPLSKTPASS